MSTPRHPLDWTIVKSEIVIDTPHLRLRSDDIVLPGGALVPNYYVRESRGFTIVLARTPDEQIVLVRQYKHGIGEFVLELPAGAIELDETPVACAARELAEETGYVGSNTRQIATFAADPTNSTARAYFCAIDDVRLERAQDLDPTESIEVELVTPQRLLEYVRTGAITPIAQVACVYYACDMLGWLSAAPR